MENQREYQTVVLASLLHDVGKLLQRGSFGSLDIKGRHPQVSADFISAFSSLFSSVADMELLKTLVQHHHEHPDFPLSLRVDGISDPRIRSLASLVSLADNFSASERGRRSEQWQDFKFTPLASVMQRVHIPDSPIKWSDREPSLHFHARPLRCTKDPAFRDIFPDAFDKYAEGELNRLLQDFGSDFALWSKKALSLDFDTFLCHLLHFLYKYAWYLPSNTQEEVPDISLFDHLRTTAAIAACLYLHHRESHSLREEAIKAPDQTRFRLVAGDISGIQSYIFAIANIGAGGVARRLRSRSLFVQLVTEACACRILKEFNLPLTNILLSAGGNFHLLLPNNLTGETLLNKVNEEIDRWFLKKLNGEMALNLASVEFDGQEFGASSEKSEGFRSEGFSGVLRRVNDRLERSKQRRFALVLEKQSQWQEPEFMINLDFKGEEACQSCGKFPREDLVARLCRHCESDWNNGKDLPNRKAIALHSETDKGNIELPYGSASLLKSIPAKDDVYLTIKLNSTDLANLSQFAAQSKFVATHIPKVADEADRRRLAEQGKPLNIKEEDIPGVGEPVTFELLAAQASGRPYLGFLKMDADNMGAAMVFGLKREKSEAGLDTISRLATLSRQIEWFFAGWVQHLVSQQHKNCYIVFSGGDDLFLVGPWNEIIDLAQRINEDYCKYTGNPQLTLSAGIAIAAASYPVSRAADDAKDAVDTSKKEGRDRITLLGHTLTWEEWKKVKEKWKELREKLVSEDISSSFLYSLLEYGRMWQQFKKGNILGLRFQPLLAYNIARNLNARESPTFYSWAQGIVSLRLEELQQKQVILNNLGLLAQLLILGKVRR